MAVKNKPQKVAQQAGRVKQRRSQSGGMGDVPLMISGPA
jgi:hypothetical protein